jgi:TolB-like protein/Tfp pilus assembly protein PilF
MPITDPVSNPEGFNPEQASLVRDHLREVLASDKFAGSRRAQDFLQLIVEHALAGRLDSLRERMIGAEMFGRPIGYDTANDAVVRVKATEVRKKLAQYYQELTEPPAVRIELPPGSYVPRFHWAAQESLQAAPAEVNPSALAETHATPVPIPDVSPGEPEKPGRASLGKSHGTLHLVLGVLGGIVLFVAIAYFGFRVWPRGNVVQAGVHSLAILPFQNLSGDTKQEYFADGITEELIADLGQVSALRVISRTSVMTYKGTKKTLPEIARELGVDAVVEGSVEREGDDVRVTAQLIDARTDRHIWARSYDRSLTSVLALQGEVAQAIANQIRIEMTPQEEARLTRARPVNAEAQDLYLLGLHFLNAGEPRKAIEYLQEAVDKDSGYAPAHAALANGYGWLGEAGLLPYEEAFSEQKAEAQKAIAMDDSLPEGHAELASAVMNLNWDWATAGREYKRALELNPNSASVHSAYSFYLIKQGQISESIAEIGRDLELDPVSSRSFSNAGFIYYFAHRYDDALVQMKRARALEPDPAAFYFPFGVIDAEKGMYAEAIAQFQMLGDQPHALGHMGNVYARMGQADKAREMIRKLEVHVQKTGLGRYEIALIYTGLNQKDDAFTWLEKSFAEHDKGVTYLKIDPCLDPLRSDPRLNDLIKRVGLPL